MIKKIKDLYFSWSLESVVRLLGWLTYFGDVSFLILSPPFELYWFCQVHQCIRILGKEKDWSRSKILNSKPETLRGEGGSLKRKHILYNLLPFPSLFQFLSYSTSDKGIKSMFVTLAVSNTITCKFPGT